jgi:hypothetical protein
VGRAIGDFDIRKGRTDDGVPREGPIAALTECGGATANPGAALIIVGAGIAIVTHGGVREIVIFASG